MASDIKDKIAKLLALADNPNEHEARAALLKARQLMAEYKLRPEECNRSETVKVVNEEIGLTCTKTKYSWTLDLATVIADSYCCKAAFHKIHYYGKTYSISLIGLEDDFEVCKQIVLYAHDCCKTECDNIFRTNPDKYTMTYRRQLSEAYGHGFVSGVDHALQEQTRSKTQEWALVMYTPKEVTDYIANMTVSKEVFKEIERDDYDVRMAMLSGYADGTKFDPGHRLSTSAESATMKLTS